MHACEPRLTRQGQVGMERPAGVMSPSHNIPPHEWWWKATCVTYASRQAVQEGLKTGWAGGRAGGRVGGWVGGRAGEKTAKGTLRASAH